MYSLVFSCILVVTSAAPQYSFPQPSPSFSVTQRIPARTYNAPTQPPVRVATPVRTYNAPTQSPARVAAPVRTYNAPTQPPARIAAPVRTYNAPTQPPARVAAPVRTYNAPTQLPARIAAPVRTYNAPTQPPARVAAPVRTYNAPATTAAPAPSPSYYAPAPAATYNAPTVRIGAPVVPILRDDRTMPDGDSGEYKFEFETGDGITRSEQGGELYDGGIAQEGEWQFTLPDGTPAVFTFVADKNGFQVQSDLLPVAPPMPAHALAQIEKARLEDEADARASASAPGRTYAAPSNTYNAPSNTYNA